MGGRIPKHTPASGGDGGAGEAIEAEGRRAARPPSEDTPGGGPAGWRVLVTGGDTGGRFAAVELGTGPGAEPPLHRHTREDELVYVLEGEVVFHLDGERVPCGPHGRLFLPRGCEHTLAVASGGARLLVLLIPAGLEGYFREMADPGGASPGAAPDFERLVTVAARYGVEITGPPPQNNGDRHEPSPRRA